jgi:hypothetical protein
MTDAARETPAAVFAIPEHALLELVQLLHHLKLQAWLMDTGTSASRPDAHLRPDAMAWWFADAAPRHRTHRGRHVLLGDVGCGVCAGLRAGVAQRSFPIPFFAAFPWANGHRRVDASAGVPS